jgi:hypothetical protein
MNKFIKKGSLWIVLGVICFSFIHQPIARAIGTDHGFYSSNDILFYDPNAVLCSPSSTSNGTITGSDNEEIIFKYLVSKGLTAAQAAGILGNMQQESTFNPAKIEGGAIAPDTYTPVNGTGFGLIQWTYTDRQQPLIDLAKSSNRKITDINLQLDYMWQELTGKWQHALAAIKATNTPVEAAVATEATYEISGDTDAFVVSVRGGNATAAYEKYKSLAPTAAQTVGCGSFGSSDLLNNFTYYNQCDNPWGSMPDTNGTRSCLVGCGPTSVAMAVTNLTGQKITPSDTFKYTTDNKLWIAGGGGTSFETVAAIGTHYGLKASVMTDYNDFNAVKRVIDAGGLVMLAGQGGIPFVPAPQAHFILIRAITPDGKFKIADPYPKEPNENDKDWDPQQLLTSSFGGVQFSK